MKLRTIEVKACGACVAVRLKTAVEIGEGVDVISVLDRHAREIERELRAFEREGAGS